MPVLNAGSRIIEDQFFFEQLVEAIENEKKMLSQNENYISLYHAGDNSSLHIYTFISLWKSALTGKPISELSEVTDFRLFDFVSDSFKDIEVFLIKMRAKRGEKEEIFNNLANSVRNVRSKSRSSLDRSVSIRMGEISMHSVATLKATPIMICLWKRLINITKKLRRIFRESPIF